MKNILLVLGIFAAIIAALLLFNPAPATADDRADFKLAGEADDFQSAAGIYRYSSPSVTTDRDTITNTAADTIAIPPTLISLWTYNTVINTTQVSGTTSVIAVLQESADGSGSIWYEVERDTVATNGTIRLHGAPEVALDVYSDRLGYVKGVRQRYILTGVGTHVTAYRLSTVLKKQ